MTDSQNVKVYLKDDGYCYPNGKAPGKVSTLYFTEHGIVVSQGSESGVRAGRGIAGAIAKKIVDSVANKNAGTTLYDYAYGDIDTIEPAKSMMTGSGILITGKDGQSFKFSSQSFAMGGMKKNYPALKEQMAKIAPNIQMPDL